MVVKASFSLFLFVRLATGPGYEAHYFFLRNCK